MVQVVAVTMEGEGITFSDNDEVDSGDSICVKSYRTVRPDVVLTLIFFNIITNCNRH